MSVSADLINKKRLREQVAEILRAEIFEGRLEPGDILKDSVLASQFDISRSPVREALLQLEKEFLVRYSPRVGWSVIELTPAELVEILSLRVVLEAHALKLAAQKSN